MAAAMDDAEFLYVSDDPETFRKPGTLFRAPLPENGRVARILFDHVNGVAGGRPVRLMAIVASLGTADGTIATIGANGGPTTSGIGTGHDATQGYLAAHQAGHAADHTVGPATPLVLCDSRAFAGPPVNGQMSGGVCFAGTHDVVAMSGGPYEVRIFACDLAEGPDEFDAFDELGTDGKYRRGVFRIARTGLPQIVPFEASPATFDSSPTRIGADGTTFPRAEFDPYSGPEHRGEYGVLKRFTCTIGDPKGGFLYQSARGGGATASYLIDGALVRSHQFVPQTGRPKVCAFPAAAGAAPRDVKIVTMPDINSTYPVQLTIGADNTSAFPAMVGKPPVKLIY